MKWNFNSPPVFVMTTTNANLLKNAFICGHFDSRTGVGNSRPLRYISRYPCPAQGWLPGSGVSGQLGHGRAGYVGERAGMQPLVPG